MIVSQLEKLNYTSMLDYFNKLCTEIESTGDFTMILKGDHNYEGENFGVRALYKLNSTANRYVYLMSNNNQKRPYKGYSSTESNPALVNTNYLCCYVSPYYADGADRNFAGNFQPGGDYSYITDFNHISVLESNGSSECYVLKNTGSIHMISFFKQKLYSQLMIKYDKDKNFITCTATSNGSTGTVVFSDRTVKGPLFKDNLYFSSNYQAATKMSTFVKYDGTFLFNTTIQDIHYNLEIGLFNSSASINKLVNNTMNLAITAPLLMFSAEYVFDDIHYIQMKNLKQREAFVIGDQEFIAFPIDSMEDPTSRGFVLGYCFRIK